MKNTMKLLNNNVEKFHCIECGRVISTRSEESEIKLKCCKGDNLVTFKLGDTPEPKAVAPKGPTVEEYVAAGYDPAGYPPKGCDVMSTQEQIDFAKDKYNLLKREREANEKRSTIPVQAGNSGQPQVQQAQNKIIEKAKEESVKPIQTTGVPGVSTERPIGHSGNTKLDQPATGTKVGTTSPQKPHGH